MNKCEYPKRHSRIFTPEEDLSKSHFQDHRSKVKVAGLLCNLGT